MGESERPRTAELALLGLLAAAGLAGTLHAYLPILDNAFICDDYGYLAAARAILAQPALLGDNAALQVIYTGVVARPLSALLYVLLYPLFGLNPRPYYLLNLAVHLANVVLAGRGVWRLTGSRLVAVLAAVLWAVAYGPRNGVTWISNLNEMLLLTGALLLLELSARYHERRWWPLLAGALVVLGCLLKEGVSALLLVLPYHDHLCRAVPLPLGQRLRRWLPAFGLFAAYLLLRLSIRLEGSFYAPTLGPHIPQQWSLLLVTAFGSGILPVFLRAVGAPELLPLLAWTAALVVLWVAFRGPRPARLLAWWLLVLPLPYSIVPGGMWIPHSHYLYGPTLPAMGLVALGLVALWRLAASRRWLLLGPLLLSWLLLRWCGWGIERTRMDEREHWQVASETLRRDFAVFDAARLAPGTHLVLVMPLSETPAGGTWWGWEGYPLETATPLTFERVTELPATSTLPPRYAIFGYDKATGPRLLVRREQP